MEDKLKAARVNLDAAVRARLSAAYPSAQSYITAGIAALPGNNWQDAYSLTLELHLEACEIAYLCGEYLLVETHFNQICSHALAVFDKCRAYQIRIRTLRAQNLPGEAVTASLEVLAMLGVHLPSQPGRLQSLWSFLLTRLRLAPYSQSRLLSLPEMQDEKAQTILGFLYDIGAAAYTSNPGLLPLISAQAIRLSLKYGNSPETAVTGYLVHGFLLCSRYGRDIDKGYAFGKLAINLQAQNSRKKQYCQSIYIYNNFISHWKEHLQNTLAPLRAAAQGCYAAGDLASSASAACSCSLRHYFLGTSLNRTRVEIENSYKLIQNLDQQPPLNRLNMYRQAVSNLMGETDDPTHLKGQYYDEDTLLPALYIARDYTAICQVNLIKLIHAVLFKDFTKAKVFSREVRRHLASLTSSVCVPLFFFYDSLARLAGYDSCSGAHKLKTLLIVRKNQKKMRLWAHHAPQNYSHKYSLVEAELERVRGNSERAMEWYDNAIHLAKEHEYLQEEALAYEIAARFYNSRGKSHIARSYIREARFCYYRWGATAKVRWLDTHELTEQRGGQSSSPGQSPSTTLIPEEGGSRLDMMTVIKASRILSSEMVLDELLKKMMRIMLESAGAQRGFLIFREDIDWVIKVRGSIYRSSIVSLADAPVMSQNLASASIINHVIHTGVDVILNDACKEGLFTNEPYILQ
jgi:hypothetical protein